MGRVSKADCRGDRDTSPIMVASPAVFGRGSDGEAEQCETWRGSTSGAANEESEWGALAVTRRGI